MHLLLVENDVASREISREVLERSGHRVAQAGDGRDALRALGEDAFDGIITDVLMPRMDGYRLCYEIRHDPRLRDLPVLIYSASYASTSDEQLAFDLGANGFLRKPATADELRANVEAMLAAPKDRAKAVTGLDALGDSREYSKNLIDKLEQKNFSLSRQAVALQTSEMRSRLIFNASNDTMLLFPVDEQGRGGCFVDANEAALQLLGYSREKLLGLSLRDLAATGSTAADSRFGDRLQPGSSQVFELTLETKDGRHVPTEISLRVFPTTEGQMAVAAVRDITERTRVEAVRRESLRQLRAILDSLFVFVALIDSDGTLVEINRAPLDVTGLRREDVVGRPFYEAYWWSAPPEVQAAAKAAFDRTRVGESVRYDTVIRVTAGREMAIDCAFSPLRDDEGRILQSVVTAVDITERKKLEQQFLRAQRMEAIGTLASGVAHDLNNILAPMLMAAGLLQSRLTESRDQAIARIIETGAQRGAGVVRQLLGLSRGPDGTRGQVQLRHLIQDMAHIIRETFPRNIELERNTSNQLWPVVGDATQLHQVLLNLCVNARDAMPAGGKLSLTAENLPLSPEQAQRNPQARPGPHVVLTVSDTGHGIAREIIDRIFDPFFTTKPVGEGTGLGLSTVLGIVKQHGGFITVYSEPGCGTAFKVYLPAAETGEDESGAAPAAPAGHGELILIVDDEESIREALVQVLEQHGYRALAAANGDEGVRLFLAHRGTTRLVLTDMMMPVMGGLDLIRALRIIEPRLRFVAMSGLDEPNRRQDLAQLGVNDILSKPSDPTQLLAVVHHALAADSAPLAGES